MHHAETLIKYEGSVKKEKEKVRAALKNCGYPDWALKEGEQLGKRKKREEEMQRQDGKNRLEEPKQAFVVLPYMKGVTERLQRAYKQQHNIQLFCKARYTIRNAVVHPKDSGLGGKMWCDISVQV